MQKLPESRSEKINFVRLHLEDFYAIYDILKKECESIKVIADNFLIEQPDEIEDLDKAVINDLSIETVRPFLRVRLRKSTSEIYIADDDPKTLGLFTNIKDTLMKSRSSFRLFMNPGFVMPSIFLFFIYSNYLAQKYAPNEKKYSLLALVLSTSLFITGALLISRPKGLFYILKRSEKKNFFERNKDKLLLMIISGVCGITLGIIGMLIRQWISAQK